MALRIVRSRALEFGVGAGTSGGKSVWFALSTSGHTRVLARALANSDTAVDAEWTAWSRAVLTNGLIDGATLAQMWREIVEFDDVLADYLADPIPVPERTVIVTGSGKETFKTFNVSTAAAILAAAAGSTDRQGRVDLRIGDLRFGRHPPHPRYPSARRPTPDRCAVCRMGLAFIPYSAFCPRYAAR